MSHIVNPETINHKNPFASRLIAAQNKVDGAERDQQAFDATAMPGTFITGDSGVTPRRRRALDRQLEKTVTQATKRVALRKKVDMLTGKYLAFEAGKIDWQGRHIRKNVPKPKKRPKLTADESLFIGYYPAGIVYADRNCRNCSDYPQVAFLSYGTLELDIEDDCPDRLLPLVKEHAQALQARNGEQLVVSGTGQTVLLGYMIAARKKQVEREAKLAAIGKKRLSLTQTRRKAVGALAI